MKIDFYRVKCLTCFGILVDLFSALRKNRIKINVHERLIQSAKINKVCEDI